MGDDNRNQPRIPRSLGGLLEMSVQQGASEGDQQSAFHEMSHERREWLQDVISTVVGDDDVKRMKDCLQLLSKMDDADIDEEHLAAKENALERLEMLVETIDNANDLQKIGGFPIVAQYLNCSQSELRWRTAELIATVAQNNPYSQAALTELGIIPTLIGLLDTDSSDQVRIKGLYALSCLTRDFPPVEQAFLKEQGFSVLMRAMQGNIDKLKVKSAFMLRHMLIANESHKDTLIDMGMVEQFASLLQGPHEPFHEHVLSAMVLLVSNKPKAVDECRRAELNIKETLEGKVKSLAVKDKEAHKEEIYYCQDLLKICFSIQQKTEYPMDR